MVSAKRKAIESLYKGTCTIYEYQSLKDPITKITKQQEVPVLENQPCRLSFERVTSVNQTDTAGVVTQTIKLFIAPELMVKPGSKIFITQNGRSTAYRDSGEPAIYSSHQEITLILFNGWA
ncbi:ABC transporter ATP-binding protein [Paenibacillus sp. FA6]|uniref:ABC transporter ATP-binding protein n=1 Tax=Paenibacillus sp. FA6 TaxID=3413029 RepID=UPI003F65C6C8